MTIVLSFSILFFVLGAIVASFLGVVVGRLYTGEQWFSGRSHCDSCGTVLTPYDLVPILSWLSTFARCKHCGSHISALMPLSEATLGTLFLLAYIEIGLSIPFLLFLIAISLLAAIVLYDLRHTVIPNIFSLSLALVSIAFAACVASNIVTFGWVFLIAGIIALSLAALHFFSHGRAMGLADAPVAFSLALLAGPLAFSGFVYSFWIGAIIGILIVLRATKGHRMGIEVPFAPFLSAGFLFAFFSGLNVLSLFAGFIIH